MMVFFLFDPVTMPGSIRRNIEELGWLQNVRIVDQNVPLTNQMKLSGKRAGEVKRRCSVREKYNIGRFS